jgi:hypothetical protein
MPSEGPRKQRGIVIEWDTSTSGLYGPGPLLGHIVATLEIEGIVETLLHNNVPTGTVGTHCCKNGNGDHFWNALLQ